MAELCKMKIHALTNRNFVRLVGKKLHKAFRVIKRKVRCVSFIRQRVRDNAYIRDDFPRLGTNKERKSRVQPA